MAYNIYVKKIIAEKNRIHSMEISHQKEIATRVALTQENERKRIAQSLHDDVGNKLNVLSLWLKSPEIHERHQLDQLLIQNIDLLIDTTRSISHHLYPVHLEKFGLVSAIEELLEPLNSTFKIEFIHPIHFIEKNVSVILNLYRIIQEFITNSIKHSKCNQLSIHLKETKQYCALQLRDDGIGFKLDKVKNGMGIQNITTRIKSLNGSLKWKSFPESGSTLIIVIYRS